MLQPSFETCPMRPRSRLRPGLSYSMADIDVLSEDLGIPWERSKDIPFGPRMTYISFDWDLAHQEVALAKPKCTKYRAPIARWQASLAHSLDDGQRLHGKLLHATLILPAGRAFLTSLEAFLDLLWWSKALSQVRVTRAITAPSPYIDLQAYSDTSSELGIVIVIGNRWCAWRHLPGWKRCGRDIGWAEAVGFFLVSAIAPHSTTS